MINKYSGITIETSSDIHLASVAKLCRYIDTYATTDEDGYSGVALQCPDNSQAYYYLALNDDNIVDVQYCINPDEPDAGGYFDPDVSSITTVTQDLIELLIEQFENDSILED